MLRQVFAFVINGCSMVWSLLDTFVLDIGITLLSVYIFFVFTKIVHMLINYLKGIQEVENEDERWFENRRNRNSC